MDRKNTAFDDRMSLLQLASVRRSVWNAKASHPRLLHMEMVAHQSACHEYNIDILKHLINLENQTRSSWASFQSQPELTVEMRTLIFDFIMCCHTRLRLSSSTLFLCYNIVDRYCSKIIVKSATYQLLGLTALWLASKFADKKPRIPSLQSLCCHQYSKQQFKDVELHILKSLNWSVCSAPTHDSFVDILLKTKIGNLDFRDLNLNDLKYGATILCELSCFDPNLNFNYNASAIALASVTIITCALRLDTRHEFQYVQDCTDDVNLVTICRLLLVQLESEERFPSSFNLKYSTKAGGLQTNPIVNCLFIYYRRLQQEEKRLAEEDSYMLEQQDISSAYDSGVCSSIEYSRKRGCTPLENLSPSSTSSSHLPVIKNFVPPTPTTPNNCLASMPPYAKNNTHPSSSLTPNASSAAVIAMVAPISNASNGKRNGSYQAQQRTPPGTSQFHPSHSKRNSSMMDIDFFDINQVAVKRLR